MASTSHPADGLPKRALVAKFIIDYVALVVSLPVFVAAVGVTAVYWLWVDGSWCIVSAKRVGHRGAFKFYQLRTKRAGQIAPVEASAFAEFIRHCRPQAGQATPFGDVLRHWAIDELGQWLNIANRTMTLVGPRPVPEELDSWYARRHPDYTRRRRVRAGVFGLAIGTVTNHMVVEEQISGAGIVRLEHDLFYIDHWTWLVELKAIWLSMRDTMRGHDPSLSAREAARSL